MRRPPGRSGTTPEYAEAAIQAYEGDRASNEFIDRGVELRLERQRILTKVDAPLLSVIIDEAVLRRAPGGTAVMRDQLKHLVEVNTRPGVEIQVIPFSTAAHPFFVGAFTIYDMIDRYPDVAFVEPLAGKVFAEDSDQLDRFERVYADLLTAALTPEQSAMFIANLLEEIPE